MNAAGGGKKQEEEKQQEEKQEERSRWREAATCYQISIKPVWSPDHSVLLIKV